MKPRYKHECQHCIFVGEDESNSIYDIWVCDAKEECAYWSYSTQEDGDKPYVFMRRSDKDHLGCWDLNYSTPQGSGYRESESWPRRIKAALKALELSKDPSISPNAKSKLS